MKKHAFALLLYGTSGFALHLTTSVRHQHACSSPSRVSMGIFDQLKQAFDDVELKRSASAAHVTRPWPTRQLHPLATRALTRVMTLLRADPREGPRTGAATARADQQR